MTTPAGYLKFAELVEYVGAAPNTVRKAIARARRAGAAIEPMPTGNCRLYTQDQADCVRRFHEGMPSTEPEAIRQG